MTGQRRAKEIRDFATWLRRQGWTPGAINNNGDQLWTHPRAVRPFALPEHARGFEVQRARREVARLTGKRVPGSRPSKKTASHTPTKQTLNVRRAALDIEAAERRRRFIERLMQPEFGHR